MELGVLHRGIHRACIEVIGDFCLDAYLREARKKFV
jgi:hypothetical protein